MLHLRVPCLQLWVGMPSQTDCVSDANGRYPIHNYDDGNWGASPE